MAPVLVALSPLVVVHRARLLSYLPTLVLFEAFAWALLGGRRTPPPSSSGGSTRPVPNQRTEPEDIPTRAGQR